MDIKHIVILLTLAVPCATATARPARQPGHTRDTRPQKTRTPTGKVVNLTRGAPKPMVTRGYLDLSVALRRGKLSVLKIKRGALPRPGLIRRFTGRYQVALYTHGLLRDRVFFNFPLTAGAGDPSPLNTRLDRSLARGVSAQTTVRVPFDASINRVLIGARRSKHAVAVDLGKLLPRPPTLRPQNLRTRTFGRPVKKKEAASKRGGPRK